jgi:uncharacterized damage-inducible protein DinB
VSTPGPGAAFLKELEAESRACRRCLERIPVTLFGWKPHEKSMPMGYLAVLVAEIPLWIKVMVEDREIDLATFARFQPKSTGELVARFDENMKGALAALGAARGEDLEGTFALKRGGTVLMEDRLQESIPSTINHLVHHRGQLTVYMRLNDIAVPSIYGPSADEPVF